MGLGELSIDPGTSELFRALPAQAGREVRAAMRVDRVAKHAVIFRQGGRAGRAWSLGRGSIRIVQTGRGGGETVLRFIAPGEMFGSVPLFTDHRLPADAIAAEESIVLSWSEADLRRLIDRYPPIAMNVISTLGSRLGQLQERVRELTTERAVSRVARAVLRLASQAGRDIGSVRAIDFPLRRRDLAGLSGTTLYTASRTLAALEKAGLLASCEGHVMVHDLPALRQFVERARPGRTV